ncbi:MAG: glycosyltransferase family protein, partial [Candidatus Methylomirabilis sp.]
PKYLPLPFEEVKRLRERIIFETLSAYQPHLFLVDLRPVGVAGELLSTLRALNADRRRPALVLGLRDVVGDPEIVRARWQADGAMHVLEGLYDEIWVYGCQALYDPIKEYQLPDTVARKVRFCGYLGIEPLAASLEETRRELGIASETFVLVTVANGRVGFPVLDAYLRALELLPKGLEIFSLVVGGPDLPQRDREAVRHRCRQIATTRPDRPARFIDFSSQLLDYMAAADLVVSMGGYNTLVEIITLEKRAIVIPSVQPHLEQFIRASIFGRLGLFRMLRPDELSPERMAEALLAALEEPPPSRQHLQAVGLDLNGLHEVKDHVLRLLAERGLLPPRHLGT